MSTTMLDRPTGPRRRTRRWWALGVSFTAVILVAAAVLVLARSGREHRTTPPVVPAPSAQATAAQQSTAPQSPSAKPTGTAGPTQAVPAFNYLPLWPFGSVADAMAWQRQANPGGHQPWRLDAGMTAQAFTNGYLGFSAVDRIVGATGADDEAWVQVGYLTPNGTDVAAAVIHLARIGAGDNRPWEVVGTRDVDLTLTTPPYGATVTSPVTVGGLITGVDESLTIQVRGLGTEGALGEVTGIPAGGQKQPWSATVPFQGSTGTIRTIVVSTASHVRPGVARFAITGVRVPGAG